MPVNNFIEFIIYIIPGFISVEIFRAIYPAKERNQFAQIGWSIFFGILIVSFIKWLDQNYFEGALKSDLNKIPEPVFLFSLLITALLICFIRILSRLIRNKLSQISDKFNFLMPDAQSIWAKVNSVENKDWSIVFLDDGAIYLGWIKHYTYNPEYENQDFLLTHAKKVDESLNVIYLVDGEGVYLNTKNVKRIEFINGE